jgi:Fe-S cluster assembly protein SufD
MSEIDPYVSAFEVFGKKAAPKPPSWVASIRKSAISRFAEIGFPNTKEEDWKYTNIEPIAKSSFRFLLESKRNGLTPQKIESLLPSEKNWNRLVFINGFYSKELSSVSASDGSLRVGDLSDALLQDSEAVERHLAHYAEFERNGFTALNTALFQGGAFIHLSKGKKLEEPIHLIFVSCSRGERVISQPRNLIVADADSRAIVIESFVSLTEDASFTNAVTEIVLSEGAGIDYYKIQREAEQSFHVGTTQVLQKSGCRFSSHSLCWGSALVRNNLSVILQGEGSECVLNGLYLTKERHFVDNHTLIDHTQPRSTSRQLYKGVLDGTSRAVFNGKVFVRRNAQKTDAHQTNKNLLLSEGAVVDTKPQLEISASDVKCTHGAAVGQLEEDAVFYLKTRGIDELKARGILTHGFTREVTQGIRVRSLRSLCDQWLWTWLQGEPYSEVFCDQPA